MTDTSRAMTSLERHIVAVLFLRQLLLWLAVWAVAYGVAVLVARFAFDVSRTDAGIGLVTLPVVLAGAALQAWRLRPPRRQLAALVDAHARCGGLVMASTEVALGAWRADVRGTPRVRWSGQREIALAVLSTMFAIGVLLVPARVAEARKPLAIAKDIARLEERVDVLREENVIDDAQAEVMNKTLDALKSEASGDDPAKAWESLDSIDEATMRAAREAAESAVEKGQKLTQLEAMAFALGDGAAADATAGMKDLADAAKESESLANLDESTKAALAKMSLTKEQLQQIADAARAGKGELRKTLDKLREKGLIDPKMLRQFEDAAKFADRQGLAKFLKKNSSLNFADGVGQFCLGQPGVSRGRGDAPMYFGEPTADGGKFKEQTLPTAAAAALAQSEVVGVSAATPDAQTAQRSAGGALTNAKSDGGSAFTAEVLPRHRGTVQRFFERKQ